MDLENFSGLLIVVALIGLGMLFRKRKGNKDSSRYDDMYDNYEDGSDKRSGDDSGSASSGED